VHYFNCKIFALRADDEHSNIDVNQYSVGKNENEEFIVF
jgi:hypothetical protein